jgi:hypothetical protein
MKRGRIPIQDDHEEGMGGASVLRPGAHTHAEQRETDSATDRRVFEGERGNQLRRGKQGGGIRLGAESAGRPGVRAPGEAAARGDPSVCGEDDRTQRGASDAADPKIPADRDGDVATVPTAALSEKVHGSGHHPGGRRGSGTPMAERAGHTTHSATGVRTVWKEGIRAAGGDLQRASVQPATERTLPPGGRSVRTHATEPGVDRRAATAGAGRSSGVPAGGHRAPGRLGREPKACTTSTPSTR